MRRATVDDWTEGFLAHVRLQREQPTSPVRGLQELCNELTVLVGRRGADALLARAVHLARQGSPDMERVVSEPPPSCEGIGDLLHALDETSVQAIAPLIGGQVLTVMARFIGDELTRNLLARISATGPRNPSGSSGR